MCGIAAIVTLNGMSVDKLVLERMTSSLRHRGPDEGGTYISGPLGFGFRRLAILDLSIAARQPMVSDDGEVILVFNGEIYNYVELRRELLSLGHTFRSRGDTEVLLRAYLQWGMDCLTRLNGMWAFLIYDRHNNRIFGSRDRFGEKPLYYYRNRNCVLFASEIKAIRASGEYPSEINWTIAARFLLENRMNRVDESFYAGIEQVSPGSAFELDLLGRWRRWRYWSTDQIPSAEVKDPADSFAEIFEDSVRLRMRSDVPLGVCLSGGLDSTSIICAVARLRGPSEGRSDGPLAAFSYITKEYDESRYISATIEYTRARLY